MHKGWKGAVTALLMLLTAVTGANAAHVAVDGEVLEREQAWVEEGTSYITLRAFAERTGAQITWDGVRAGLETEGLEITLSSR